MRNKNEFDISGILVDMRYGKLALGWLILKTSEFFEIWKNTIIFQIQLS